MNIICLPVAEAEMHCDKDKNILFVMPATDLVMANQCATLMASRAGTEGTILIVNDTFGEGFVSISNKMFRASKSVLFGYVAQDAFPGRGWLKIAAQYLCREGAGLLAFNDGKWHGRLAAFGLVSRQWAKTNYEGELFYSGYRRHYADAELTLIAKRQNQLCYNPHSVLVEIDWHKDDKPADINDKKLFTMRARKLFNCQGSDPRYFSLFNQKVDCQ